MANNNEFDAKKASKIRRVNIKHMLDTEIRLDDAKMVSTLHKGNWFHRIGVSRNDEIMIIRPRGRAYVIPSTNNATVKRIDDDYNYFSAGKVTSPLTDDESPSLEYKFVDIANLRKMAKACHKEKCEKVKIRSEERILERKKRALVQKGNASLEKLFES